MLFRTLCLGLLLLGSAAHAQYSINDIMKSLGAGGGDQGAKSKSSADLARASLPGASGAGSIARVAPSDIVLDRQIDPATYRIGTGDVFSVYIWGNSEREYTLEVNAEGRVTIPLIGVLEIGGLLYSDARDTLTKRILSVYKNVQCEVSIQKIRRFKVHIAGVVKAPGTYIIDGLTRVSEAIDLAGGLLADTDIRRISIVREDRDTSYADLAAFRNTADISANPYIAEGSCIAVMPLTSTVDITGSIKYPGSYSFRPGEKLSDLITVAGGLGRGADSNKIIVNRFVNDADSLATYEVTLRDAPTFTMQPDDRVLLCGIPDYREHRIVNISGEVRYPGTYPVRNDKTRLVDVIAMAGGLSESAYLRGSKIIRREMNAVGEREFNRLKGVPPTNLSPLERSYLKTMQTEEGGLVSIDFEKLFEKGSDLYNIILRDSDQVFIERKPLSVKVMGAVVSPGLVSFVSGKDYRYYIEQAGGFNTGARRNQIRIMKGGSEVMLKADSRKEIEAGDALWIPESEYRNGFTMTKEILQTIAAVATIIIGALTIKQLAK